MERLLFVLITMAVSNPFYSDASLLCHCANSSNCQGNASCSTDGACFSKSIVTEGGTVTQLGCWNRSLLTLCDMQDNSLCCHTPYCNTAQTQDAATSQTENESDVPVSATAHLTGTQILQIFIAVVAVVVILFVSVMVVMFIICCHRRRVVQRRHHSRVVQSPESGGPCCDRQRWGLAQEAEAIIPKGQSLAQLIEYAQNTTADGHLSTMVQKTIVCRSGTVKHLHSGRFGELYLGKWRDEQVAIKVFSQWHSDVWYKEVEVYQTPSLQHKHLHHFIAADLKQGATGLECWLVTEYHENRDLRGYLQENSITLSSALRFSWSIASGLAELHEFRTQPRKLAIAHCNISSANILLKSNRECCLGDMTCCVTLDPLQNSVPPVCNSQELRYRAPELMEESSHDHVEGFDAHLRGDVYSLGLILWEICRRCDINGQFYEAVFPYEEELPLNSSVADARELLFVQEHRPAIPGLWEDHEVLRCMVRVMRDCWSANFLGRPSSSSVRDTLCILMKGIGNGESCKDNVGNKTLLVDSESDLSSPSPNKPFFLHKDAPISS